MLNQLSINCLVLGNGFSQHFCEQFHLHVGSVDNIFKIVFDRGVALIFFLCKILLLNHALLIRILSDTLYKKLVERILLLMKVLDRVVLGLG